MKNYSLIPTNACALLITAGAALSSELPPTAFLPPAGQTVHYRFSDTVTTSQGTKSVAGLLALTGLPGNNIQAIIAVDGKQSRRLNLQVEPTGALEPVAPLKPASPSSSEQPRSGKNQQHAATQLPLERLSLAALVGAHPDEATSFPTQLYVPWASGPVNPMLYVKPTTANTFIADASDTTAINPPQKQKRHLLFPAGLGILGGAVGGAAGRVVGAAATGATAIVAQRGHSGPLTADIKLHINGQLAFGSLRTLSGDQEEVIHNKRHTHPFSDRWSLVAV